MNLRKTIKKYFCWVLSHSFKSFFAATSCRGYLNKVGAKPLFSNLRVNNRWWVFDRERQMLVYYSDKNEKKPRGGAYFNAITDVYFDHSATKNNRTFIVKTKNRSYILQAPSQQSCSIWIDVSGMELERLSIFSVEQCSCIIFNYEFLSEIICYWKLISFYL